MSKIFPEFVDKQNIEINIDRELQLRYFIKIPIKYLYHVPVKKVLVILKNPSEARVNHKLGLYESDQTVDRVLKYFHKNKYTEVTIVNLFARFYKESENLNDYVSAAELIIGYENDTYIKQFIDSSDFERIVVAWGGYPENSSSEMQKLYNQRISKIEALISGKSVYYVERMVGNKKFPKHGMTWTLNSPMIKYF